MTAPIGYIHITKLIKPKWRKPSAFCIMLGTRRQSVLLWGCPIWGPLLPPAPITAATSGLIWDETLALLTLRTSPIQRTFTLLWREWDGFYPDGRKITLQITAIESPVRLSCRAVSAMYFSKILTLHSRISLKKTKLKWQHSPFLSHKLIACAVCGWWAC